MGSKIIKLSFNPEIVKTKAEGEFTTDFMTREFDLENPNIEKELREIFKSNVHSVNHWLGGCSKKKENQGYSGYCLKVNYRGVWGLALDYDDGELSLADAREKFKDYIHIIYTSSGHRQDKPDHNGIQDRFRVILPYAPTSDGNALFSGKLSGKKYYDYLEQAYPDADPLVFNMHMKLFPFAGQDLKLYEFYLNKNGKWFSVTSDDIKRYEPRKTTAQYAKASSNKPADCIIHVDDEIILPDRTTKMLIGDIDKKQPCFCLFCDDLNSRNASAFVDVNDHGEHYLFCSHCDLTYWSDKPRFKFGLIDLYFDHKAGHPTYFDQVSKELKFFKNQKDWLNFCIAGKLNPMIDKKLPRAKTTFDPTLVHGLTEDQFNMFTPSEFLKTVDKKIDVDLSILKDNCPRIFSVLRNLFGDDDTINLYLNWIGFILQERRKSTLAWIITTEARGTGKEVLMSLILGPIFGKNQAQIIPATDMTANFNSLDVTCWMRTYDEVFLKAALAKNVERREWLKNKIGSNHLLLEYKGIDKMLLESHMNFVLLSNYSDSILLEKGDRRFNVVRNENAIPLNTMTWWTTGKDMEDQIEKELPVFAQYVQSIKTDYNSANSPTENDARANMLESSKEDMELVADALRNGDIDFFELDEAFPYTNQVGLNIDYNKEPREVCRTAIEQHNALPSTHLKKILGRFFRGMSVYNMRRKLKNFGVKDSSIKINGKTYRVWMA
ncbi:MAG: hypothetical protein J7K53_06525 [Bacteroidales bacterium]|nr:hypothetical protein [Bacteroidales bacterium]